MNKSLLDYYNKFYLNHDKEMPAPIRLSHIVRSRHEMAVMLSMRRNGRYLEIGPGSSAVALTVLPCYNELTLVEISPSSVDLLRRWFDRESKVKVLQANIESDLLPIPDNSIDTVLLIDVIEHMVDPFTAISEIYRVMKPYGQLIINTPNIAKWTRRIKLLCGVFPRTGGDAGSGATGSGLLDGGHLHYFTFDSLAQLCRTVGFADVERHGYGDRNLRTMWWLSQAFPTLFSECCVAAIK